MLQLAKDVKNGARNNLREISWTYIGIVGFGTVTSLMSSLLIVTNGGSLLSLIAGLILLCLVGTGAIIKLREEK